MTDLGADPKPVTQAGTSPEDVARIAAGLSDDEREAVMHAEADGTLGLLFVRFWHTSSTTLRVLIKHGLGTPVWSGLTLTPLGRAVRRHLQEHANGRA